MDCFLLDSPSQNPAGSGPGGPAVAPAMPSASGSVASTGGAPGHAAQQGPDQGSANHAILWAKTQQLPEEAFRQLHSIYGDHFPLEARHHLAGKLRI